MKQKPVILLDREQRMLGKAVTVRGHLDLQGAEGGSHYEAYAMCTFVYQHVSVCVGVCLCGQSGCLSVHLIK